ncbi:hypothetical protein AB0L19_16525 [Streptomyces sioyaensis]
MLSGRERAEAIAHLDRCADCQEHIEQLALVGDGLLACCPSTSVPSPCTTGTATGAPRPRCSSPRSPVSV